MGIAWESGLAVGLSRRGVDLAGADRIVGTSAGSVVGAQLAAGLDLVERAERLYLQPPATARPTSSAPCRQRSTPRSAPA